METSFCCGPARESLLRRPRDRTASGSYENFSSGAPCGRKDAGLRRKIQSVPVARLIYLSRTNNRKAGLLICILQH
jgi:hypothetical protein